MPRLARSPAPRPGPGRSLGPVSDYNAPHYWLDYRGGFVRRGLPGALLRARLGRPPTYDEVARTGVALARGAAAVLVTVVGQTCRADRDRAGTTAAGVLLLSPLTVSLVRLDTGRYDAAGVLALGAVVASRRLPPPAAAVVAAGAAAAATACEEFLIGVLAPPVVVLSGWRRAPLVLAPAALVAAASLLVPVPEGAVAAAREEARAAGVPPAGPMGDALGALERGLVDNLAFFRLFEPGHAVGSLALWAGLYAGTAALVGRLLRPPAGYGALVAAYGGVGTTLSVLGTDFRRWWGLALTGLVATLAVDPRGRGERRPPGRAEAVAAAVLVAVGLAVRDLPVYPWGPLRDAEVPAT
jgi:hypothetical protein